MVGATADEVVSGIGLQPRELDAMDVTFELRGGHPSRTLCNVVISIGLAATRFGVITNLANVIFIGAPIDVDHMSRAGGAR